MSHINSQSGTSQLLAALDRWRIELAMDHRRFATHLGLDESAWANVRAGRRPLPRRVVAHVLRLRPEFQYFLIADLTAKEPAAGEVLAVGL
jgi:hypothetical protein